MLAESLVLHFYEIRMRTDWASVGLYYSDQLIPDSYQPGLINAGISNFGL